MNGLKNIINGLSFISKINLPNLKHTFKQGLPNLSILINIQIMNSYVSAFSLQFLLAFWNKSTSVLK